MPSLLYSRHSLPARLSLVAAMVTAVPLLASSADAQDAGNAAAAVQEASTPTQAPGAAPRWVKTDRPVFHGSRPVSGRALQPSEGLGSFAALERALWPGLEVLAIRPGGSSLGGVFTGTVSGSVAEVTPDHLVIVRRTLFHREEMVLRPDDIERIDVVDSTRNGALMGAVLAFGAGLVWVASTKGESLDRDVAWLGTALLPVAGGLVGAALDALQNSPVYERPRRASSVTVGMATRGGVGVAAHVRF